MIDFDSADIVARRPPSPWLVKGLLAEQSFALLYGEAGCNKSFLALDLAASIAAGLPDWQGHRIPSAPVTVRHGGRLVVYVAAEGGTGMPQRLRAWKREHPDCSLKNLIVVTQPLTLGAEEEEQGDSDLSQLIAGMSALTERHYVGDPIMDEHGEVRGIYDHVGYANPLALLVIDTVARTLDGDENTARDMGRFVKAVDTCKDRFNCSVIAVHHTGHDPSRERGSSALKAAVDTKIRVEKDMKLTVTPGAGQTSGHINVYTEKQKDGMAALPFQLRYEEVELPRRADDDPDSPHSSLVITTPTASAVAGVLSRADHSILSLFTKSRPRWTRRDLVAAVTALKPSVSVPTAYQRLRKLVDAGTLVKVHGKFQVPVSRRSGSRVTRISAMRT